MKPFNLEEALSGKAVMLRNGEKAYVRHHETELSTKADETLLGYFEGIGLWSWALDGKSCTTGDEAKYDIIGMYPETRIINGFEVPAPEINRLEFGTCFYLPSPVTKEFYKGEIWNAKAMDEYWLDRGLVFLNEEDAIANAKAMLGIDPYEGDEE